MAATLGFRFGFVFFFFPSCIESQVRRAARSQIMEALKVQSNTGFSTVLGLSGSE